MTKLKLNALNKQNLDNKEMNEVRGGAAGDSCCCSCRYAGTPGGSSSEHNLYANLAGGITPPGVTFPY